MSSETTVIQSVTPAMAEQWLRDYAYEHQRPLRERHVRNLAAEMEAKRFRQNTQIHLVAFQSRLILIDGQHRIAAIVKSGQPQSFAVLITSAETSEEVALLYGTTDIGLRRSASDYYSAMDLSTELDLQTYEITKMAAALNFMQSGCVSSLTGMGGTAWQYESVPAIRLYAPYMRQFRELRLGASKGVNKSVMRAATISVALLSLRFSVPVAESRGDPSVDDFWRGVIHDDGISATDPRKLALRHITGVTMIRTKALPRSSVILNVTTAAYSTRYLASCFNAYMDRREIKSPRVVDSEAALAMYGVPVDPAEWVKE